MDSGNIYSVISITNCLPFLSQVFPNSIAEKLDDSNYLLWKQHVKLDIKSHKLHRCLVNPMIPSKFLNEYDNISGTINPTHEE